MSDKSNTKSAKKTAAPAKRNPGRPEAKVIWPKGKFTFIDLCILNGATDANGKDLPKKERRMCKLTLRNHLRDDMFREQKDGTLVANPKSEIVLVKGEKGKVTAESKLGRKPLLYVRRSVAAATNKAKATARKAKADVSVPVSNPTPSPAVEATPVTA